MDTFHGYTVLGPVCKGWSGDEKYCISDAQGKKYLLRIVPPERRERMAEQIRVRVLLNVPTPAVRDHGEDHLIEDWLEGEDAEQALPRMTEEEQYSYGLDSGLYLRAIHALPAPEGTPEWEERFNAKIDRKIRGYRACGEHFDGDEELIAFIEGHRSLLKGRPNRLQHGDYHIGNMFMTADGLRILDWDKIDYGDPWEELNRIVWSAQAAPAFATGMLDGYFGFRIPEEFWQLLLVYIGSNTLGSVPWGKDYSAEQLQVMLHQADDVMAWYDRARTVHPAWYRADLAPKPFDRLLIVGSPGGGKSTLAGALQEKCGLPLVHLDLLYWNADRTHVAREEFDRRLAAALTGDRWIIDGNFERTIPLRMQYADTVWYLDYAPDVCLSGLQERFGKPRPDMPWVEKDVDSDFVEYVRTFREKKSARILSLLHTFGGQKLILHSREAAQLVLDIL